MKNFFYSGLILAAMSFPAVASNGDVAAKTVAEVKKETLNKPKGCPAGFISIGVITKIETSKSGMVTESFRTSDGTIRKMPAFKANKLYVNKVGDAYCMDTTPDND